MLIRSEYRSKVAEYRDTRAGRPCHDQRSRAVVHPLGIAAWLLFTCIGAAARGDDVKAAQALADGVPVQATIQADGHKRPQPVTFGVSVDNRCIEELTLQTGPNAQKRPPRMWLDVLDAGGKAVFHYRISNEASDYLFFPVLDRGAYRVQLDPSEAGFPYTLQIKRVAKVELTDQERAAAQAAIDRGTQRLLAVAPAKARDGSSPTAVESLVMAALATDPSGKFDEVIDRDYVPWLTKQFNEQADAVRWNGHQVAGLDRPGMYCQAIATLGLGEAAAHSKAARAAAERAAEFLMATQATDRRPKPWGPVKKENVNFGGWRYGVASQDGDVSVSGWCLVALTACAAADVQPAGMRESLRDGVAFVRKCGGDEGFAYQPNDRPGLNSNAIGALVFRLNGQSGRAMTPALDQVDRNLSPAPRASSSRITRSTTPTTPPGLTTSAGGTRGKPGG